MEILVTKTTTTSMAAMTGASVERPASSTPISRRNSATKRFSQFRQSLVLPSLDFASWPSKTSSNARCSLEAIHLDVLVLVLQHLNWPGDLHSLSLVSHKLNVRVTPELYRTIYILPSPHATLSLLEKLDKDAETRDAVNTLVFDSFVRSVRFFPPDAQAFDSLREKDLSDNLVRHDVPRASNPWGDPDRLRLRLYLVLPKLRNLRSVYVKRWDEVLMGPLSASECYHYWSPGNGKRSKKLVNRFRSPQPYTGPPPVMHGDRQPSPLDIISLLLLRCKSIEKLCVSSSTPYLRFTHPINTFSHLTTLIIGENCASVNVWNDVLKHCSRLRVLALLNVHFRFEKLFTGCHFPELDSIEWYGYAFSTASARKSYNAFAEFIQKHERTLTCIALAPRLDQPLRGLTYEGGLPFFEPDNGCLNKLQTLRLKNWSVFVSDHDSWPHTHSTQFRALAEQICRFVEQRPSLVDLTISDLPEDLETRLRESLAHRQIHRLLIGEDLLAGQRRCLALGGMPSLSWRGSRWSLPGELVRRRQTDFLLERKREYLQEVWHSYEVMFEGLALEESGWRPFLLESKSPRRWIDYLKIRNRFFFY